MTPKWISAAFFLIFGFSSPMQAGDEFEDARIGTPNTYARQVLDPVDVDEDPPLLHIQAFIPEQEAQNRGTWVRTAGEVLLTGGVVCSTLYGVSLVCTLYCVAQLSNGMSGGGSDTFEIFKDLLRGLFF
jgi:hypothetical protein